MCGEQVYHLPERYVLQCRFRCAGDVWKTGYIFTISAACLCVQSGASICIFIATCPFQIWCMCALPCAGVGMSHLSGEVKRLMSTLTKYDQDNYPEMLGRICIINAPFVFKAIWGLVKPLLNPRTLSKIQVRGLGVGCWFMTCQAVLCCDTIHEAGDSCSVCI